MIMPEIGEIRRSGEIGKAGDCINYIWHACEVCGKERWVVFINNKRLPKSHLCRSCASRRRGFGCERGQNAPAWKSGSRKSEGYIYLLTDRNDFFSPMRTKDGYVLEHRLVMAKHLGRNLQPWEIVHHKGTKYPKGSIENRSDNRLENLQLVSDDRHKQITILANRIALLEKRVGRQAERITLLEAENTRLETQIYQEGDKINGNSI